MNTLHRTARTGLVRRVGVVVAAFALLGGGAALAQDGTPTFTPASEHDDELDPCETDATAPECVAPSAEECLAEPTPEGCDEPAEAEPAEDACLAEPTPEDCEEPAEADETRSETAEAVHRALTVSEEHPEGLRPGDLGFGQAVAANARERGGNGPAVSRAARGDAAAEEELEAGEDGDAAATDRRGNRPSHAGGPTR